MEEDAATEPDVVLAGTLAAERRKPIMQQKNLVVFIALSLLILIGWPLLVNRIWPPKPPGIMPPQSVRQDLLARLSGVPNPAIPGVTNAIGGLLTQVAFQPRTLVPPPLVWRGMLKAQRERLLAVTDFVTAFGPAGLPTAGLDELLATHAAAKVKPRGEPKTFTLGSTKDHFLTAVLTTKGAGVQELVLNKFQAATREGRPAGHELALIQADPVVASFLMYHYPHADKEDSSPVTTLGERLWEYKEGDENRRVFTITLPGKTPANGELVITKTYTLEPRTYHLGLTLAIEHKSQPGAKAEPLQFRYQLAGPHGIPIEGEWYTSVYRNPMIGEVDARRHLWREDVEQGETQLRISFRQGGDKVPPAGLAPGSFIQYAGIANQYFASLIVVDDKQPPAAEGGVDFKSMLSYVRPTLVTEEKRGKIVSQRAVGGRIEVVLLPTVEAWEKRGKIKSIGANQGTLVLVSSDKGTEATYHLLPRAKEVLERERLGPGSEVVLNFDKTGDELVAFDIRPVAGVYTFRLLPRVQERLEQDNIGPGSQVVLNYYAVDLDHLIATDIRRGRNFRPFTQDITVRAVSATVELKPGEKVVHKYMLYNGPVKVRLLGQFTGDKAVDAALVARYADDLYLRTLTDYRSAGPLSALFQKIMWTDLLIQCTRFMHWLLNLLHFMVGNYGLSIILLTFLVRGAMFPISRRQALISIKMQELAPEVKKLQEKYKNDPQGRTQAQMELYRRHNVSPLGGCLPLLLQMPIFLGLYYALQESIHFRLAPFLWIQNLAAPDMLFRWGEHIPLISDPDNQSGGFFSILYLGPFFNLLPVVAVVFMIMQQKLIMPPPTDEQQALNQKIMKYMMIFMGIMFYKVAAGLCLYFIVSSVWGLAERKLLPKRPKLATATVGAPPASAAPRRLLGGGPSPGSAGRPGQGAAGRNRGRAARKEKTAEVEGPIQKVRDWWADVLKQAKKK
jgi:YidC/Oxa1 family membrane protein insertase